MIFTDSTTVESETIIKEEIQLVVEAEKSSQKLRKASQTFKRVEKLSK